MPTTFITISSSSNKTSGIKNPNKALPTAINGTITDRSNVKPLSVQQATYIIIHNEPPVNSVDVYHKTNSPQGLHLVWLMV